jgi:hypothetical protein
MRVSILIIIFLHACKNAFISMLWTGGTFIQMFYIAHLHHRLVLFTMISFNIFFTASSRNVSKKTLQFETIEQEISDIMRCSPCHPVGSHYIKKSICCKDFVQFDAMHTSCCFIQLFIRLEDNNWFVLPRNWTVASDEDRVQLVSSRVKVNGCCPWTQKTYSHCFLIHFIIWLKLIDWIYCKIPITA